MIFINARETSERQNGTYRYYPYKLHGVFGSMAKYSTFNPPYSAFVGRHTTDALEDSKMAKPLVSST